MADCPKCGGAMEEGFILDHGDYGSRTVSSWAGGVPHKSIWTGLKVDKKNLFDIATWRCRRCGFLESFARTPSA